MFAMMGGLWRVMYIEGSYVFSRCPSKIVVHSGASSVKKRHDNIYLCCQSDIAIV